MEKLKIVLILSFFVFLSCSKSSDDTPDTPKSVDKSQNLLGSGDSANDILSNDKFTKLKVEIAYVQGFRPTDSAINDFVLFLKQHTFKDDIEMVYKELESPGEETLTLQEIADLESDNRTAYNDGETLAIYIYFADAPSDEDEEEENLVTLGAVYRNTSMVIHEVTVRNLASLSSFISVADVESATLNHEFGHLFGLVNLGSNPVNSHEDIDAPNHCNVQGCLMRGELQFGSSSKSKSVSSKNSLENGLKSDCSLNGSSVLRMLETRFSKGLVNAPGLDSECILDLQANGGQ